MNTLSPLGIFARVGDKRVLHHGPQAITLKPPWKHTRQHMALLTASHIALWR